MRDINILICQQFFCAKIFDKLLKDLYCSLSGMLARCLHLFYHFSIVLLISYGYKHDYFFSSCNVHFVLLKNVYILSFKATLSARKIKQNEIKQQQQQQVIIQPHIQNKAINLMGCQLKKVASDRHPV